MEMWGQLVCLNSCAAAFLCACVVSMCFQSVMDGGQVQTHGALTKKDRHKDRQTDTNTQSERRKE